MIKKEEFAQLKKRVGDLEAGLLKAEAALRKSEQSVTALFRYQEVSPCNKPETHRDFIRVWEFTKSLWIKKKSRKAFNLAEIRAFIEFTWFLTDGDLLILERATGVRHCWRSMSHILSWMRADLMVTPGYADNADLQIQAKQIDTAATRLGVASNHYLFLYDPVVQQTLQAMRESLLDPLTALT